MSWLCQARGNAVRFQTNPGLPGIDELRLRQPIELAIFLAQISQIGRHVSLVMLPLWAFAASAVWLAIGAFLRQVMVQGAWGVIPVHLNELSPDDARGTFPGFVYQLGNLIASFNATLQAGIAAHYASSRRSSSRNC
jgi:hypothetical protein